MNVDIIPYGGWKRNARLSDGDMEIVVTLDVGPRIIRYGFVGGRNVFGEFPEQAGRHGERSWCLRGGHRLWIAPEDSARTYEPDNEPVDFKETAGGLRIVQKAGPVSGIRKAMTVRLARDGAVQVRHELVNAGRRPVACAPWALSVMAPRGTAIIPLPAVHARQSSPNQNWSIWSYTDLADARLRPGTRYVRVTQDPRRGPMKLGMAHRQGWVGYVLGGLVLVKRFRHLEGRAYPDGNVNFEVYTDERILELESLGPLVTLQPGARVRHEEQWTLHRRRARATDEDALDRTVLPLATGRARGR